MVSLMQQDALMAHGFRMKSRNPDTPTVIMLMLDTMDLLGFPSLCIFSCRLKVAS